MNDLNRRPLTPHFTYIITSYRDAPQIERLLGRIRSLSPKATVIISHDRKGHAINEAEVSRLGGQVQITDDPVTWGDGSYLHSVLKALSMAQTKRDGDWYTILTSQDYPLRPLAHFESYLETSGFDAFLEGPDAGEHYEKLLARYTSYSFPAPHVIESRVASRLLGALPRVSIHRQPYNLSPRIDFRLFKTPFGPQFKLYKGCDLFSLNGHALRRLLEAPASLLKHYDRTRIPSESYPHTVLFNDPSLRVKPEKLHYTEWKGGSHPQWLEGGDVEKALHSEKWFARKFRVDSAALDALDDLLDAEERDGSGR